ncbi:MAG: flavodoxin-dependent (E)-4-hydroxy-3-methylbut-2-enyl-diphosphate synthase [Firmicutes bacterium]|nr:flavodoxin-dependent (E)-4-hydroxy-3-methylbut-2-enyl-diphosphate synthase [Bacillota bacterium]
MRTATKKVNIGGVVIGGGEPIAIQSMTNVSSRDKEALIKQISELEDAGCEIVRIAIPDSESAEVLREVKKEVKLPIVADIHFDYRLAIASILSGADKIRINPGNIGDIENVRAVVREAKTAGIPIRVGVNSGSLEKDILEKYSGATAEGLAESAIRNLRLIEDMGFDDLVVSLKSSNVVMNYEAHKIVAENTDHPIHIGVTEAGTIRRGKIKSAVGIGALLLEGIGDTMRVSLTSNPVNEVIFANELLETVGMRMPAYDLVSCPTCGRTKINLEALADKVDEELLSLGGLRKGLKIAVMGCAVNGPGEARGADYGIAGGEGKGIIFSKGEIIKSAYEEDLIEEFLALIKAEEGIETA